MYTYADVYRLVFEGEGSIEESVDIQAAVNRLSGVEKQFVAYVNRGCPTYHALRMMGITENSSRFQHRLLMKLLAYMNGEEEKWTG